MKTSRIAKHWVTLVILSVALSLAWPLQPLSAQQPNVDVRDLRRIYEREQQRQAARAEIEADRQGFVSQFIARWDPIAREHGFSDGWSKELESVLLPLSADRLLAASRVKTYQELVDGVLGRG
ncbi:MAG: hypothetical protein ACRD1T_14475, partial [Acidimicrobiia bacterium]